MGPRGFALVAVFIGSFLAPASAAEFLDTRPGVQQPFLYGPGTNAFASVILLAGGNGRIGLNQPDDNDSKNRNFLVRTRGMFRASGLNAATVDVPTDHRDQEGLSGPFRISADHAHDLDAVAAFMKAKYNMPVFLVGTSRGTISATNAAARQKDGTYAGVVLTSAVTGTSKNDPVSIGYTKLDEVRVPVLIVYHQDDRCVVSRPSGVPGLVKDLAHAPSVKTVEITGGKPKEDPDCEPLAPHGFYGKEQETIQAIAAWIRETVK
jgi:hypothetical protein